MDDIPRLRRLLVIGLLKNRYRKNNSGIVECHQSIYFLLKTLDGYLSPKQKTFLQTLQSIPMDKPAIHDIRLTLHSNICGLSYQRVKVL